MIGGSKPPLARGGSLPSWPVLLSPQTRASPVPTSPSPGTKLPPKPARSVLPPAPPLTEAPRSPHGDPGGSRAPLTPCPTLTHWPHLGPTLRGPTEPVRALTWRAHLTPRRPPARSQGLGWGRLLPLLSLLPLLPLLPTTGPAPGHAHQRGGGAGSLRASPERPTCCVPDGLLGALALALGSCRLRRRKQGGRGGRGSVGVVCWPPPSVTHSPETRMGGGGRTQPCFPHPASALLKEPRDVPAGGAERRGAARAPRGQHAWGSWTT